jgi:16S rRNA (adenine1518-N6/adenine1519-N6)-dimethyltransferase
LPKIPFRVNPVQPKKSLGQHFLTDQNIALKIVKSLTFNTYRQVLEIGPGKGILSRFLLSMPDVQVRFIEIDPAAVHYLEETLPDIHNKIVQGNALHINLNEQFQGRFAVIGNFPYNISSQLFFKILEHRDRITEVVCMVQKEVAQRLSAPPGTKTYGILSVLLQAYFRIEYLFTVSPGVFQPPPRVQSAVIRLFRNERSALACDEHLFHKIVKTAFNQRRKIMRNSLKGMIPPDRLQADIFNKRPEQLGVDEFVSICNHIPV